MVMPNFLIIGAAKAGTTSLYQYLKQHPEIYMSPVKETRFFAYEGKLPNIKGPDISINHTSIVDIIDYQKLFKNVSTEKAIGEASPLYLYSAKAPERIKHYLPKAKLIAILRHPAERAYSSYMHLVKEGHETLSFSKALQAEGSRISDGWSPLFHYRERSFYFKQIKQYLDIFEPHQLKIYLYDNFCTDTQTVLKDIFQFLEVNDTFISDISTKRMVSGVPKNKLWHKILTKPLKQTFKLIAPYELGRPIYRKLINKTGTDTDISQRYFATTGIDQAKFFDLVEKLRSNKFNYY
jgi:hypothetical protein